MFLKAGASLRKAIGVLVDLVLPQYTAPTQPAFMAYADTTVTNQTGAGTAATVGFNTEVYDQASNFSTPTFTAPITGRYHFSVVVQADDLTTAMSLFRLAIVTSNRSYYLQQHVNVEAAGHVYAMPLSIDADMDAADTASVQLTIFFGAGDTADINGAASTLTTYWSGRLVA